MVTKKICLVIGDSKLDAFMKAADVFEPFRNLIFDSVIYIDLEVKDEDNTPEVWEARLTKFIEEAKKEYRVTAIFVPNEPLGWKDENCKAVSTGNKWMLAADYLKTLGCIL